MTAEPKERTYLPLRDLSAAVGDAVQKVIEENRAAGGIRHPYIGVYWQALRRELLMYVAIAYSSRSISRDEIEAAARIIPQHIDLSGGSARRLVMSAETMRPIWAAVDAALPPEPEDEGLD